VGVDKSVSSRLRPRKALNDFIARFGIIFLLCAVLSIGGGSVALGVLPFERYIACQQFVWKLTFSTQGVIYTGADLAEAASALRRVYSVSDRADEASQRLLEKSASRHGTRRAQLTEPPPVSEGAVRGQLSLRNVTFAYPLRPDSPVFNGLDLEIDAGKTTALVGMSGSGKSTVHALIARFYEPQGGTVLLDGVDISTIDRDWYAEKIGIVSQAPVVFAGTVRDAIAYGAPDRKQPVAQGLVERAARLANAHDFIMALPDGYDADVGVGGSAFSGGQLQRIAIARAIVRDADVWLLDEATSALDSHSETAVQQALDRLTEGKTALIVAHRLSTIRNADKVVVLGAAGRVLEHGSYKELVRRPGGAFARLIETQTETFMSE
jgi:ABC-type multidrug transport system fused ATPase/permease subunit